MTMPSPAELAAEVHKLVLAAGTGAVTLSPDARRTWVARLNFLLASPIDFDAYVSELREVVRRNPFPAEVRAHLHELDVPADEVCRGGADALADGDLITVAARPNALRVLAEFVHEVVDQPGTWPQWQRLLREADTTGNESVRPELVAKLTDIARAHPAYSREDRPEPRPAKGFKLAPIWAALAASVLIAAGFLGGRLSRPAGREVALAGNFSAAREPDRGGAGFRTVVRVENRSDRRAFCAVVGLRGARSPVEFEEKGRYIEVAPGETRAIELPAAQFTGVTDAVVVLTATPAGEPLQRAVEAAALPADPAAARDRLAGDLAQLGYVGTAVELVRVPADR